MRSPSVAGAAVAQLHPLHRDRADPGLDQPLRAVAVPHQALAPVRQPHALHRGQERLGLRLDRLGQQPAGAAPQDRRQRIVDRVGLTEGNNGAIARHGVSLLREVQAGFVTRLDTPPFSHRHHPVSAIALRHPRRQCGRRGWCGAGNGAMNVILRAHDGCDPPCKLVIISATGFLTDDGHDWPARHNRQKTAVGLNGYAVAGVEIATGHDHGSI